MVEGLVDGVVGADQEIRARRGELVRGAEHQRAHARQVACVQAARVLRERGRVHRHLGVRMRAEQRRALDADGLVAKGRAFGGAADDSDVQGHGAHPTKAGAVYPACGYASAQIFVRSAQRAS
ncbi:hypothetical protein D3C72_1952930 [compost metagenome]